MSKIGIKAKGDSLAQAIYAKKQSDGHIEAIVASYPAGLMRGYFVSLNIVR